MSDVVSCVLSHPLSTMVFAPVAGMAAVLALPRGAVSAIRWISAFFAAIPLVLAVWLYGAFDRASGAMQLVERTSWIPAYNIEYYVGVDGLSVTMVLLTALLSFLCIFASWGIEKGVKGFFAMFLLLEAGMMGVFVSLDFFLFYVFWEVMLLPMYFLIGVWGGPRREYAAIKFFLYTLAGSVLMLLVILAFYWGSAVDGHRSFDIVKLADQTTHTGMLRDNPMLVAFRIPVIGTEIDVSYRMLLFLGLFIGFAIKVPVFPFHTWLPDAHVEAPTPISVILAGVLLKMGTYGILRISYPILPDATLAFAWILAGLGVVNILYGAFCAMAQTDLKKMVAYSSVSHMGYVLLGMASFTDAGLNGALFQMFNHGTITAMLFLLVGVVYDRAHHREIAGFGGLGVQVPRYMGITTLAWFAAIGLPGLSGFWSEAMVFLGSFQNPATRLYAVLAVGGIVIGAGYMLWSLQRIFLGPLNEKYKDLPEINGREIFTLAPLGAIVIFLGVYPMPVLNLIRASVESLRGMVVGG